MEYHFAGFISSLKSIYRIECCRADKICIGDFVRAHTHTHTPAPPTHTHTHSLHFTSLSHPSMTIFFFCYSQQRYVWHNAPHSTVGIYPPDIYFYSHYYCYCSHIEYKKNCVHARSAIHAHCTYRPSYIYMMDLCETSVGIFVSQSWTVNRNIRDNFAICAFSVQ